MKSLKHSEWSKYDERLLRAVENGDIDRVTATLKKGAIPTRLDAEGCSALHLAASKGLINSLNVFLGHGVNLHATDASGKTALHLSSGGGHSACVQRLLQVLQASLSLPNNHRKKRPVRQPARNGTLLMSHVHFVKTAPALFQSLLYKT
uniref:Uncharacterized protein n=1 Tax=Astyanax mexicanus TaxID=7994 RepID=A0A3B1KHC1_ASTMX